MTTTTSTPRVRSLRPDPGVAMGAAALADQGGYPYRAQQLGEPVLRPAALLDQAMPQGTIHGRGEQVAALLLADRELPGGGSGPCVVLGRIQAPLIELGEH